MTIDQSIIEWANEREIFANANPHTQFSKTLEEVNELLDGINSSDKAEIKDAIGDIYVTLVLQAEMQGLNMPDCIASAYNVIKSRTGKMVDGKFVKDGE